MTFIWIIAICLSLLFVRYYLFPFVRRKIRFYFLSKKIKKIANKTPPGESRDKLNEISIGLRNVGKEGKI